MECSEAFEQVINVLKLCKQYEHIPYTLLLTSSISFTPEICREICHSENWNGCQAYLHGLGDEERLQVLTHFLRKDRLLSGYQALARLIKQGYFSTILTCNLDSWLEEALWEIDCQPQVLIVSGHSDKHIATWLDNPPGGVCILKLHGSLKERSLPATFPHLWELPLNLQASLKRYLNRGMIVVDSIAQDRDVSHLLERNGKNSIYYVLPEILDPYDEIIKVIEARGHKLETHLINGASGTFTTFFTTIETLLPEQPTLATTHQRQILKNEKQLVKADVVLATVTGIETQAVLELFPGWKRMFSSTQTYYDLGFVQKAHVFLVEQSMMGSGSEGGSLLTISEAIRTLSPSAVIMVGIAFGIDESKYTIGDILVSQQVLVYEHQRVGHNSNGEAIVLSRGPRPNASPWLLSRFKSGARDWQEQRVEFGLILSGEKLIDHLPYRNQVHALAPEAIGGEMEGAGLYVAAQTHKVDWILVKAICDWADGQKGLNKQQYQEKAARNAAQFSMHVLQQGGFSGNYND
jgi:nucleoside phosphorylase